METQTRTRFGTEELKPHLKLESGLELKWEPHRDQLVDVELTVRVGWSNISVGPILDHFANSHKFVPNFCKLFLQRSKK